MILQTARLSLHAFTHADAPFILALLNDPDFVRYIGDKQVRDLAAARAYLDAGPLASYAEHGFGLWRVSRLDDRTDLGMCGLIKRPHLDHPDVGYAFLPAARGQGYAREAVEATLAHARAALGLRHLLAIATRDNSASARVLAAAGFRITGSVPSTTDDRMLDLYGRDL